MDQASLDFFTRLLNTPSPSGYEAPVQQVVRDYCSSFADSIHTDLHGNVIAARNPGASQRVLLAGHCDQIGFCVHYIDNDGFLYVNSIGGWDPQVAIAQKMTVWASGGPIFGAIARKPIHLLTEEERNKVPKLKDLWVDIGAKNREEAAKLVNIGDPVTPALGMSQMLNGLVSGPSMDNKTGLWVAIEALRRTAGKPLKCALFAVSTVAEEIGLRGATTSTFGVDPQVGIAIDVTHATDCPTIDKKHEGDIALGKGPVIYRGPNMNHKVTSRLMDLAKKKEIAYQPAANGRAVSNDANAIQISRAGVATGLVSIPNRYMHSPVEMISLSDIDRAADLLAEFALSLGDADDFTP